jgi:hypothetical protein
MRFVNRARNLSSFNSIAARTFDITAYNNSWCCV